MKDMTTQEIWGALREKAHEAFRSLEIPFEDEVRAQKRKAEAAWTLALELNRRGDARGMAYYRSMKR